MRDLYILIGTVAVLVGGVWLYNFIKEQRIEHLKELSYKVYLFEKGKLSQEEILKATEGTPFYPYVLAKLGKFQETEKSTEDEALKGLYRERFLAQLYTEKKFERIVRETEKFKRESFNYPSVKSLEAFSFEKLGKKEEAVKVWNYLKDNYPGTYFGNLARVRLYLMKE